MGASTSHLNSGEATARESISESVGRRDGWGIRIQKWLSRHPWLAIVLVSALAVIASSYPVIFCGRSYVSPTQVGPLISDKFPSSPGIKPGMSYWQHDSDTAATLYWGVPVGFIESRSILDYGEIPLWNRYGHAGDILLGQAVSMLGDPLQLIVILGRGSAGAWDVKFLMAKLLFCVGFGWLILRRLDNRGLAVIYAALGAYCGAYIFINNHPVFFVLAYAPWILLSAVEMMAGEPGNWLRWMLLWLAANAFCFNAGHVETAVILIGGLNLAALAFALISRPGWPDRARIFARVGGGTLLFLGLTAPVWVSFLVALPQAYTVHSEIKVTQLPPASFMGLFDDYFYHGYFREYRPRAAPGTSLLVMAGGILSLRRWRYLREDAFFWVNTGAILFWAACVFAIIPASLIALVPFVNRVGHVQADFSFLLVIHLTVQSAYGFKTLLKADLFRPWDMDFLEATVLMLALVYLGHSATFMMPYYFYYFVPGIAGAIGAPALFKYLLSRNGRVGVLGWSGIIALGFLPNFRFGLYTFGSPALVTLPGPRMVLNPPLAMLSAISQGGEPFRIAGTGLVMAADYAAVYGQEDIHSCAPLSNGKYIELLRSFPGMSLASGDWAIMVEDFDKAQRLLNLLNVKYVMGHPADPMREKNGPRAGHTLDLIMVTNHEVWPRAFFTSQIVPVSSTGEFIGELLRRGNQPFAAVERTEAEGDPALRQLEHDSAAAIVAADHYQLLPNSTAFDIRTTAPGLVCLTEGQADDFLARANGRPVKVLTVNRAFKGVYLDQPGNYHVEFRYRPRYWNTSVSLFWLATGIVLTLGALELRRVQGPSKPLVSPRG